MLARFFIDRPVLAWVISIVIVLIGLIAQLLMPGWWWVDSIASVVIVALLVKEGRELVEYCAGELEAVSRGLEELRLEELVTRLESAR